MHAGSYQYCFNNYIHLIYLMLEDTSVHLLPVCGPRSLL